MMPIIVLSLVLMVLSVVCMVLNFLFVAEYDSCDKTRKIATFICNFILCLIGGWVLIAANMERDIKRHKLFVQELDNRFQVVVFERDIINLSTLFGRRIENDSVILEIVNQNARGGIDFSEWKEDVFVIDGEEKINLEEIKDENK